MNTATAEQRLNAIVEQELCIGCGLCESVAGHDTVEVRKGRDGYEVPHIKQPLDHETVDRIYAVCPGVRVEGLPERLHLKDTKTDNVWGSWRRMVRCWASDPDIRHRGATGGVLTALASWLIESNAVEFMLHARANPEHPSFGQWHLSFSSDDVIDGAGSRYGPTAVLKCIDEVLSRDQPFAFIGKPCDIGALRNLAKTDSRVDKLVRYWLTPVCGGFMPPKSFSAFLKRIDVESDDVLTVEYRGNGCPGPTQVQTHERTVDSHYLDFWGEDESQWHLPFRCKVCPDGIGEAADIAAADSWPGGSPTREGSVNDPGTNAVIARSKAGQDLLEEANRAGVIGIEYDISPDEMSIYQPHQMRKKYAVWPRHQGLGDEGLIVPETSRLRIKELAEELPESHHLHQRLGARQRVGYRSSD